MANRPIVAFSQAFNATPVTNATPVPYGVRYVRIESTNDCYIWIGQDVHLTLNSSNGVLVRAPAYGETFGAYAGDLVTVYHPTISGSVNVTYCGMVG